MESIRNCRALSTGPVPYLRPNSPIGYLRVQVRGFVATEVQLDQSRLLLRQQDRFGFQRLGGGRHRDVSGAGHRNQVRILRQTLHPNRRCPTCKWDYIHLRDQGPNSIDKKSCRDSMYRKITKMGSCDSSQNQSGISAGFSAGFFVN